jgi:hypothetical protein
VARVVEREIRGDSGLGYTRHSKAGYGTSRSGSGKPNNSDWVMVKGGKEQGVNGSNIGGSNGPRNERQAQSEVRRPGLRDRGYSHLTYNEILELKQKGLCFKCRAPFHPKHQCPEKHLRVFITDGEEEEEEDGEEKLLAVEKTFYEFLVQ